MFENLKKLKAGRLSEVSNKMIFPLIRWISGSRTDILWCSEVNKYFFWIPNEISKGLLYIGLKDPLICKYPKAHAKETGNKVFELQKRLIKEFFSWSEQEFSRNPGVEGRVDFEEIAQSLGVENKERKMLGLEVKKLSKIKFKKDEPKAKPKVKGIFDFGKK